MDLQMRATQLHDLHREEYFKLHPEEDMLGVESIPTALAEATRAETVQKWADAEALIALGNAGASTLTQFAKEQDEERKAEIGAEHFADPEGRDDGKMTPERARALGLIPDEDDELPRAKVDRDRLDRIDLSLDGEELL
jgi:hypothetical protein